MAKKISPYGIDKEERGREPSSLQHYEHYYYIPQPSHQLVSLRRRAATTASSDQDHPCGILHYSILTNRYPTALVSLASTSARARKIITRVLPYCIACLYERSLCDLLPARNQPAITASVVLRSAQAASLRFYDRIRRHQRPLQPSTALLAYRVQESTFTTDVDTALREQPLPSYQTTRRHSTLRLCLPATNKKVASNHRLRPTT